MEHVLTLSEKLLLLAVRPEKGGLTGISGDEIDYSLVGAVLLEMTLSRHLAFVNNRVEILAERSDTVLYTYMLERMARSPRPRKIGHWLEPFTISKKRILAELYQSLVHKKEIRLEDRHFLFFKWKKPFLAPGNHAYNLINEIKNLIYQTCERPEDIFLLTLLEPGGLLRRIYPERGMRNQARQKIRQFLEKNQSSESVIQAVQTAKAIKIAITAHRAATTA